MAESCRHCSAPVSPENWLSHCEQFHSGDNPQAWNCPSCPYASLPLAKAIAHSLLDGHSLPYKMRSNRLSNSVVPSAQTSQSMHRNVSQEQLFVQAQSEQEKALAWLKPANMAEIELTDSKIVTGKETGKAKKAMPKSHYRAVQCSKCGSALTSDARNISTTMVRHVKMCLDIKPFSCSACGHQNRRKDKIQCHIKSICPTAVPVEKKQSEAAIEKGLKECFPIRHGLN